MRKRKIIYPLSPTAGGGTGLLPQLFTPTLSIDGRNLTISDDNGGFITAYNVMANGSIVASVNSRNINLYTYLSEVGTYSITVIATCTQFVDSEVSNAVSYGLFNLTVNVTDGTYSGAGQIITGESATITFTPITNYELLEENITIVNASKVSYDGTTGVLVINNAGNNVEITAVCTEKPVFDPVLANNTWAVIRQACEAGVAANYWALGDAKTIVTNNLTREYRIADMSGLYNKHVVFASWNRSESNYQWDADNVNDYSASDMVLTHLAVGGGAYNEFVDAELGAQLTDTTVKVAKQGNNGTIVEVTQKLFLPALKEITSAGTFARAEENAVLTTFAYFLANDTNDFRVRHKASAPTGTSGIAWWTRSPNSSNDVRLVGMVNLNGGIYDPMYANNTAISEQGVAPCFSF